MYWEDVYRMVKVASNYTADEKNATLKFQFFLQATEQAAKKWKDSPLPFPSEQYLERMRKTRDVSGINQLPDHLKKQVKRVVKSKSDKKDG